MSNTEETNKLSAEEYLKLISRKDPKDYLVSLEHIHYAMESFASMRVDEAKKEWEKDKIKYGESEVIKALQNISKYIK